jgi:hypothetical protein
MFISISKKIIAYLKALKEVLAILKTLLTSI